MMCDTFTTERSYTPTTVVMFYYKNKHQNEQRNSDKTHQGERQKNPTVT